MAGWYTYAILALGFLGTQRFLYKVSAERNCNTAWTTFSFMATVALLSSTLFVVLKESITNIQFLLFIALLNSGAFLLATITHIEALKHIPAGVAYPVIRLNAVVVVIFSIVYFKDRLTFYQVMGIVLAMAVIFILTRHFDDQNISSRNIKRGFIFMFISLLGGSIASISSKFAAIYTNKMAFIAISYIVGTLFSFGLRKKLQTAEASRNHKDAIIIGLFMGLINFAGYYSFLKALSMGPLSIIVSITGMHFVIAIILTALIYKEKLTSLRILGISLSIFSIILLRL
jgi:drug/metabolite transporter (DMT)-like permease